MPSKKEQGVYILGACCDGRLPSCETCIRKSTDCQYDAPADQDEILSSIAVDNASMMNILGFMQSDTAENAWSLLEYMRNDDRVDVAKLARWVRARQPDHSSSGASTTDGGTITSDEALRATHFRDALRTSLSMLRTKGESELSNAAFLQASTPMSSIELEDQSWTRKVTLSNMLATIDLFFSYNEEMGPLVRQEHAKTSVHEILKTSTSPPDMSVDAFFHQRYQTREDSANMAEVFAMAAVGARYHRKGNLTQRVPDRVANHFYGLARQMLDATIEFDPFRAMKVCLLLTTYNVILKPTVALAYTELGLALGRLHKVETQECPPTLGPEEFKEHKRTWRSLLLTASWLGVSIGLARTDIKNLSLLDQERHLDGEDIIQREHAKIAIIKADIMHMLPSNVAADTHVIHDIQLRLQMFHSELPEWLTIGSLPKTDQSNVLKRMIMYLHLFFLSAMQLLHRKIVSNSDYLAPATKSSPITMAALREGLMAAKITARIIRLMHQDSPVENICWIFSTYMSAVVMLHAAVHKALGLLPLSSCVADLALISGCVETLSHCAQRDKVAGHFQNTLTTYQRVVQDTIPHDVWNASVPTDGIDEGNSVEYLLVRRAGSTPLHKAARDLRRIIAKPFSGDLEYIPEGGPPGPKLRTSLVNWPEAMMGTSQEWTWDVNGCSSQEDNKRRRDDDDEEEAPLQEILALLRAGHA